LTAVMLPMKKERKYSYSSVHAGAWLCYFNMSLYSGGSFGSRPVSEQNHYFFRLQSCTMFIQCLMFSQASHVGHHMKVWRYMLGDHCLVQVVFSNNFLEENFNCCRII